MSKTRWYGKRIYVLAIIGAAIGFALMPATVSLVQADPSINVDGTLSPGEWSGAASFPLDATYTAYITNDGEFMYVAFDYPVTTGSDFASFNTYKLGAFVPETITAPCVSSWGPVWDTIVDEDTNGVPETWHREDPTTRYDYSVNTATEIKVPLAELGLSPEDTIKLMFVLNTYMTGPYIYPVDAGSFDLATYADWTLLPTPPRPPPPPVGGTAYPENMLTILAPWIAIGAAIIAGATIFMRRRRAQS